MAAPPPGPIGAGGGGAAPRRPPALKVWLPGGGGGDNGGDMQSCGRWWGRLAARGASRHLRPVAGGAQRRWNGGGEASRCIEQLLPRHDDFSRRHIGPREREKREMLRAVGVQVGAGDVRGWGGERGGWSPAGAGCAGPGAGSC